MIHAVPDIPRLYTALAEWSACFIFIVLLCPKERLKKLIPISAAFLVGMGVYMDLTANVWIWLWIPCMIVAFLGMSAFIYLCTGRSYKDSLYYAVMAFGVAELVASIEWEGMNIAFDKPWALPVAIQLLFIIVFYGAIELAVWFSMRPYIAKESELAIRNKDLSTVLLTGIIIFAYSNMGFVLKGESIIEGNDWVIAHTRTVVALLGVIVLYAQHVRYYERKIRSELEAVQSVLHNQYQQYKLSRETVDVINYKYHDLKHQINLLRNEFDPEKKNEYLNKMENDIKAYELQNKTGNPVLDTVLTSKSLYCDKHGITLTSVVDGKLLDFMDVMDICNVFGNALDNAIESVIKIADKEKRLIHVSVSQQKDFLLIRIENYYESDICVEDGSFVTTKEDRFRHGYGIKSIQYIVNKYDGVVNIDTENQWFDLKILIPLKG